MTLELFLECSIACLIKTRFISFASKAQSVISTFSILLLVILFTFMTFSFIFLRLNKTDIREKEFSDKWGEFTFGLDHRNKDAQMYHVMFMLRRIVFALIAVNLFEYNFF